MSLLTITDGTKFARDTVGAFAALDFETYKAAPGMNKSGLDVLRENPRRYHLQQTGQIVREATAAMQMGTLLHDLVLFGNADVHIQPETYGPEEKPWNGNAKECRAWKAAHAHKPILTEREHQQLRGYADCVLEHPQAARLLRHGESELSVFARAEGTGYLLKGRLDHYNEDEAGAYFLDIKTTLDASTAALSREIYQRRYHVQFALYRMILRALGVEDLRVFIVAVEKGDLPRCNVKQVSPEAMDHGEVALEADLALYRSCRMANWWPDFADEERDSDTIQTINLPDYVLARSDALVGATPATLE